MKAVIREDVLKEAHWGHNYKYLLGRQLEGKILKLKSGTEVFKFEDGLHIRYRIWNIKYFKILPISLENK